MTSCLDAEATIFSPQHGAAPTLDQVELRVKLVGTVDGDIDLLNFVEGCQRYSELVRKVARRDRGGDAANLQPLPHPLADTANREGRSRAGAESDHLPVVDVLQGGAGRQFFFRVVGHSRCPLILCVTQLS